MTDFDDKEISLQDGAPFELYEWVGTYRNYYMTSDNISHNALGNVFNPVPGLKRSSIKASTHEEDDTTMTVSVPITEQLVKDYGFQITPPSLKLTIYRFQRDAGAYVPYWKGPIASIQIDREMASIKIPSRFGAILQGNIPNVYIQPPCNNVLYDDKCKVSRVDNSINTTVVSIDNLQVTVEAIEGFPAGWFTGGEIAVPARNERRMINLQTGTVLDINYNFSKLLPGTIVQITAGCDHSYLGAGGCPKFNNMPNYGGMPYVPGESNNPFTTGIH